MKRLKKLISIAILLFLIVININCSYATEEKSNIGLKAELEEKQYKQGDIISLEVKINSLPEIQEGTYKQINTLGFDLIYDKDILEINKIYDEDDQEEYDDIKAVRGWQYSLDSETNCILLINYDMYSTLDQTILKINLKVKEDFKTADIKFCNIEASGGVGEENNFKSENDLTINIQGTLSEPLYLSTEVYKIGENDTENYEDGDEYIYRISPSIKISDFINNLSTNGNISVYNANGEEETNLDELVKTGMILKVTKEGCTDIELKISVIGDISLDGKVTITDFVTVNQHLLKEVNLEGEQFLSADINDDKKITITDFVSINQYILKEIIF